MTTPDEPELTVHKMSAYLPVSTDLLMDMGVIPGTRPPRPKPPLRLRLRVRIGLARDRLAARAFRLIAGYDVPEGE